MILTSKRDTQIEEIDFLLIEGICISLECCKGLTEIFSGSKYSTLPPALMLLAQAKFDTNKRKHTSKIFSLLKVFSQKVHARCKHLKEISGAKAKMAYDLASALADMVHCFIALLITELDTLHVIVAFFDPSSQVLIKKSPHLQAFGNKAKLFVVNGLARHHPLLFITTPKLSNQF